MFKDKILPVIAVGIIKFLSFTYKLVYQNLEIVKALKENNKKIIFAFWHGRQFILVNSHKNRGICIMTSLSRDGDLQTKILKNFGYEIVRGSSSKGGTAALVLMIKKLRQNCDLAFAVDGPRGPIYEAKPGVLFLAQKTGAAIVPVAVSAQDFWQLKNWDQYLIPKPFTTTVVRYGTPIFVNEGDDIEASLQFLNTSLNELREALDSSL